MGLFVLDLCAGCLNCNWIEDNGVGQPDVLVYFVLCRLMGCCNWLGCCIAMCDSEYVSGAVTSQAVSFSLAVCCRAASV